MKFSDLDLHPDLMKGIEHAGFTDLMQVQEETYVHAFRGLDVAVQSQTGTGKTAAFVVSIFQRFLTCDVKNRRALIIAPTRELAVQIWEEARLIGKYLPFRISVFYGGVGYDKQESDLRRGVDIIIGTPGRIIDFNQSGKMSFQDVGVFVIDEADRLFDMGFLPDIKKILRKMPSYPDRQTMLFSATLDERVKRIARDYMHEPVEVEIISEHVTVDKISQVIYHIGKHEKVNLLVGLMRRDNPKNAIIFTNMKSTAEKLAATLKHNGFDCQYIIGDLPQKKRLQIINDVKSGKLPYLIATDVAARGLHIDDLELVVNYDLPENPENYVHRIGRTARVGKSGKAVTLVCEQYVYSLEGVEDFIKMKIPVEWPEEGIMADVKPAPRHHREERVRRDEAPGRDRKRGERRKPADRPRAERPAPPVPAREEARPDVSDATLKKKRKRRRKPKKAETPTVETRQQQPRRQERPPRQDRARPAPPPATEVKPSKSIISRIAGFFRRGKDR